jgi:hypothetical protein
VGTKCSQCIQCSKGCEWVPVPSLILRSPPADGAADGICTPAPLFLASSFLFIAVSDYSMSTV